MPSAGRNLAKLLGANKKVTLRGGDSDFNVDFDSDVAKLASLEATVKAQLDSDSGLKIAYPSSGPDSSSS